jgi:hypothetical protein
MNDDGDDELDSDDDNDDRDDDYDRNKRDTDCLFVLLDFKSNQQVKV